MREEILQARDVFEDYVNRYDHSDPMIRLKHVHSLRVADISRELAREEQWSEDDVFLAELIGLLHDIGRFEQIKMTNTFDDSKIDHAQIGYEYLRKNLKDFTDLTDADTEIVLYAVKKHSGLDIGTPPDARTRQHAELIRDADKSDIWRVHTEIMEGVYPGFKVGIEGLSQISDGAWNEFSKHHLADFTHLETWGDFNIIVSLCFAFDLNTNAAKRNAVNQGWLDACIEAMLPKIVEDERERINLALLETINWLKNSGRN